MFSSSPTEEEIFAAHVFTEPVVAVGGTPSPAENQALAAALASFVKRTRAEDVSAVEAFLRQYPASPWRPSLLTHVGIAYFRSGYFTRAQAAWEEAWRLSKDATGVRERGVADLAFAELVEFNVKFARQAEVQQLLDETRDRDLHGSASQRRDDADRALMVMLNSPRDAFRCGPMAIDKILSFGKTGYKRDERILTCEASRKGTSLHTLHQLARTLGHQTTMVRSPGATDVPVPAVVHWKLSHYSALVARDQEKDRYLVRDPTLGDFWMAATALSEEASGYFLLLREDSPPGWESVRADEAKAIFGTCHLSHAPKPGKHGPCDPKVGPGKCGGQPGMPQWAVHPLLVNLNITDIPLGYTPPRGPAAQFGVTYNDREVHQPQNFNYSHLGRKWTFDWLAFVYHDPGTPKTGIYVPGGGWQEHDGVLPDHDNQAVLIQVSANRFERRFPDGSLQVFAQPEQSATPRKVFMTEWKDPQGNSLTFTYDATLRLVAATDAIGQVTTVTYGEPADPYRITRVTDPFDRFATFGYDPNGRLVSITDVIGMTSTFSYGAADFISSMTTPYGTTRFVKPDIPVFEGPVAPRRIDIWDAEGGRESVEYNESWEIPQTEAIVPAGMNIANSELVFRNSFYWDKRATALHPTDYRKARVYHWILDPDAFAYATLSSEKAPLENRVWYNYPGQPAADEQGTINRPTAIGRVLDDGSSQIHRREYNSIGNITKQIDPLGRETVYEYATNDIDILRVKQKNGSSYDLLATYTYNTQHLPLTYTDAAGQTSVFTYNTAGQLETATNAKSETWTLDYDPLGYLETVTGPVPAALTSVTWDGYGRPRTVTNPDNYTITVDYDALDRVTRVSYPNGTFEEMVYDRLHPQRYRDLLGRWTNVFADRLGRITAVRDPAGRMATLQWCDCGGLEKLIDGNGNATTWERDSQGRVTREVRADGRANAFVYETTTSRIKTVTDAREQQRHYQYFTDDRLKQVSYLNAQVATPTVALTYDPVYGRMSTRGDGTGTTGYTYHPIAVPPALGAGRLATIDGPLGNDVVAYDYDELGRPGERRINNVPLSVVYDTLGRVTTVTNPLGAFTYDYDGTTGRLAKVSELSGLERTYNYFDQAGDRQLREIRNKVGGTTISVHTYTYGRDNNIATWLQEPSGGPARRYEFSYDGADQLRQASFKDVATGSVVKHYGYDYDNAGNRRSEAVDTAVTSASFSLVNELTQRLPGGALTFAGTTNEPATVKVQDRPAATTPTNEFQGTATVGTGTATVTVEARDYSNNVATRDYQVSTTGETRTLSYDANGNMTSDGVRTLTWDASDRLVAIDEGTHRTEFAYDGFSRRARIVEKDNGSVTSDKRHLWVGTQIVEERDAAGSATTKRFFGQGVQVGSQSYHYLKDHLGSIREMVDSTGTVRARYDYDPYGRRTKTAGDLESDFGFTGHYTHATTGLALAPFRAYDANLGRWLSQDPIGVVGGANLYAYVENNPINFVDRLGLDRDSFMTGLGEGLAFGAIAGLIAATGPLAAVAVAALGIASLASALYQMQTDECLTENQIHQMLGGMLGGLAGGWAGFKGGTALKGKAPSGLGDLTNSEAAQIQSVVNEAGRPLHVAGSAASGSRRGAGTDLPIGKGPGTRSDIDYLAPPSSLDYFGNLAGKLPSIDPQSGIIRGVPNPNIGPTIPFVPTKAPMCFR